MKDTTKEINEEHKRELAQENQPFTRQCVCCKTWYPLEEMHEVTEQTGEKLDEWVCDACWDDYAEMEQAELDKHLDPQEKFCN